MLEQESKYLTLKKKILLSLGIFVAAMIILFNQTRVIKAQPEENVRNETIKQKLENSDTVEPVTPSKVITDSTIYHETHKSKSSKKPGENSISNNTIFDSI